MRALNRMRDRLAVPINSNTISGMVIGVLLGASLSAVLGQMIGVNFEYEGNTRGTRLVGIFDDPRKFMVALPAIIVTLAFIYGSKWWANRRHSR